VRSPSCEEHGSRAPGSAERTYHDSCTSEKSLVPSVNNQ
jgi:hypothetical protein